MQTPPFFTELFHLTLNAWEYAQDAFQRSVLYWDLMRRRGNTYLEHLVKGQPPVLVFQYEIIMDGRDFPRPVNYALAQITDRRKTAAEQLEEEERRRHPGVRKERAESHPKRPIVIIDPRAGHGPGIGGSKRDSEIGMALDAGHPVYFILFHTYPEPGQTLADVVQAEIAFLEEISRRHPGAEKPAVIGNCQGGWAAALIAAARPDVTGPLVFNGSPLSYWAGVEGKNPMRYRGGLTGGTWMASLWSDLGGGIFDGANLVAGFEDLNPANTLWSKQYHVYENIDTEEKRFLNFEKWWGGFFYMTAEEIHFIVESLFVGNRLEQGMLELDKHRRINLKNIHDPVLVFASSGDNITPPQQALNWIVKTWKSVDEIKNHQQVIVYLLHETIGHLGIFVSGQVSKKEHKEIIGSIDLMEYLSPGLYEMVIQEASQGGARHVTFEAREFADILQLDDRDDDEDFRVVSAVSEFLDTCYGCLVRPFLKPMITGVTAEFIRQLHPLRASRYLFSDLNPLLLPVGFLAPYVRESRRPVSPDNPFLKPQQFLDHLMTGGLDLFRELRDQYQETLFYGIYRHPWLESVFAGKPVVKAAEESVKPPEASFWLREMDKGGFLEGVLRIMVAMADADQVYEKEELDTIRNIIIGHNILTSTSEADLKSKIRLQMRLLQIDWDRAIDSLPQLIRSPESRLTAIAVANAMVESDGKTNRKEKNLLKRITALLKDRDTLY
ncbi:MAG: DUF3141 domain-containing protein [Thermodesulfobacteriota bacterium]